MRVDSSENINSGLICFLSIPTQASKFICTSVNTCTYMLNVIAKKFLSSFRMNGYEESSKCVETSIFQPRAVWSKSTFHRIK